jgi:hypothetical protein
VADGLAVDAVSREPAIFRFDALPIRSEDFFQHLCAVVGILEPLELDRQEPVGWRHGERIGREGPSLPEKLDRGSGRLVEHHRVQSLGFIDAKDAAVPCEKIPDGIPSRKVHQEIVHEKVRVDGSDEGGERAPHSSA